jgi:hypothetical protein
MKKDSIVQFVCFETPLNTDEFVLHWDQYCKQLGDGQEVILQQEAGSINGYKYMSQHILPGGEFQFLFKKGRRSSRFPEVEMKVKELGGYMPMQVECTHNTHPGESKIFVFVSHAETDMELYRKLSGYQFLNIYQAYYESSNYSFILEFFAENSSIPELIECLKLQIHSAETGLYKECKIPKALKKVTHLSKG